MLRGGEAERSAPAQRSGQLRIPEPNVDGEAMRLIQPMVTLPFPSTSLVEEPFLSFDGANLSLRLVFFADGDQRLWEVVFERSRSFVHRAEPYCTAWHYENSYDVVTVVDDSPWVAELERAAHGPIVAPEGQHFVLTIDSWGSLEVLASRFRVS